MPKLTVKIVNCETGEEFIREMTDDELADYEAIQNSQAKEKAEAEAKAAARQAILDRLGITEDEAKLLLG